MQTKEGFGSVGGKLQENSEHEQQNSSALAGANSVSGNVLVLIAQVWQFL